MRVFPERGILRKGYELIWTCLGRLAGQMAIFHIDRSTYEK